MILILLSVSLLTRFIFLYFGYPSITNDEADYFLNSYLLSKTGSDILGNKLFLTSGILNATSSIPVYLGSLFFLFLEKSVIAGRLPYVILNSLIPVLFYLILDKLTKNKKFSMISFTVLNFSPWFTYLSSQSAIDAPTALCFYLLGLYFLFTNIKKSFKNLLVFLMFFFSFNSYMGIKVIFPFLIFIAFISNRIYKQEKINLQKILKDSISSFLIFIIFFFLNWHMPAASLFRDRMNDKILPLNQTFIANRVNNLREISIGPMSIRYALFNKVTVIGQLFLDRYIQAFNPYLVYMKGDNHPIYGTNYYGLLYVFDFALFFIGLIFFMKIFKKKLVAIPFILLLIFTPIALGLMTDQATVSLRAYPMILGYVFFISCGLYFIFKKLFKLEKFIVTLVMIVYMASFLHFFLTYKTLIRYMSGDQWHINEKRLVDKIEQLDKQTNKKIIIHVNGPKETLLLYLFYKINDAKTIKKILTDNNYHFGKIYFTDKCPEEKLPGYIQIMNSSRCPLNSNVFKSTLFINPENNLSPNYLLLN